MQTPLTRSVVALATALGACSSLNDKADPFGQKMLEPHSIQVNLSAAADERRFEENRFREWLENSPPELRALTARVMGRIADKKSLPLLEQCLRDPSPSVQEEAIFALGQIGARGSASVLIAKCADSSVPIRLAAVEALGKLGEEQVFTILLRFLEDSEGAVRAEAALALYRLFSLSSPPPKPLAEEDAQRRREAVERAILEEKDPGVRWRTVFALASFADPAARATLVDRLRDPEPLCRNFAAWGLDKITAAPEDHEALRSALQDPDDAVVARAALALGKRPTRENATALALALQRDSFHARRAAAEALGGMKGIEEARGPLLQALSDSSVTVRAEARLSLVKIAGSAEIPRIQEGAKDAHFLVRGKCAAACTLLPKEDAIPLLEIFLADEDVRVASAAASALRSFPCDEARKLALQALERDDLSVRAEAAETLGTIGDPSAFPSLLAAFSKSTGHEMDEAREKIQAAMRKLGAAGSSIPPTPSPTPPQGSWILGKNVPYRKAPSFAEIETEKGSIVLELYPDEAPNHVENFIALAAKGHFDGTIFHRVVTNWVVQGADHRGDGWGATSSRGGYLRDEIGRRRFVRGSVGMPKGETRDTGGCQIFVTLLPTPKLDGRYTMFGQVVEGVEILDRLEIGDRILRVRSR